MSQAKITLQFVVPVGHCPGDYAVLYGNGGEGNIDWNTPLSENLDLFPGGGGILGLGQTPLGQTPLGQPWADNCPGLGQLPCGLDPCGLGSSLISASHYVEACGNYKFAFTCYDSLGNIQEGTPEEAQIEIHLAPAAPSRLKKHSYNKDTDVLVLEAT
jgi:hypothetical protein